MSEIRREPIKTRSLKAQFDYILQKSFRPGVSKRIQRKQGVSEKYIYSYKRKKNLKDTAKSLAQFMRENFPEIRLIRDLRSEHISIFCRTNQDNWSQATRVEMISRLKKLETLAQAVYTNSNVHFCESLSMKTFDDDKGRDKVRDKAMSEHDFRELDKTLQKSRSKAKFVAHIIYAIGARVEETVSIRPEQIDLSKQTVKLTNCKGGRNRTVEFDEIHREFFENLKAYCLEHNWETVAGGLSATATSKQVRRTMDKLHKSGQMEEYENTGCHAIRKLYSRHQLATNLGVDMDDLSMVSKERLKAAWPDVQVKLGHGVAFRKELFETYIGLKI